MALGGTLSASAPAQAPASDDVIEASVAPPASAKPMAPSGQGNAAAQAEALSALGNLGYSPSDAATAVAQVSGEMPDADTAALIKAALKQLAPKG